MRGVQFRWQYGLVFLLLAVLWFASCSDISESNSDNDTANQTDSREVPVYTYRIVNRYPHDRNAFTQGLVFADGVMYEGTGGHGESSVRRVELETGRVLQIQELPAQYFGEGITIFRDTLIQLTWRSNLGFVYDRGSFELLSEFTYPTEGWGITHDGEHLIMSDGTSTLYFINPETFSVTGHINVYDNGTPINWLNELEYINGRIYANVWRTDSIVIINPDNGRVTGWIDLSGLLTVKDYEGHVDVLNGIAYDSVKNRLFVTGKLWPWLFEIELVMKK